MAETPTIQPWMQRPAYKYGMLALIAILGLFHLWALFLDGPGTVDGAKMGLTVIGMLLVNHLVATFVDPSRRRRYVPLQIAVAIGGLAYIALKLWRDVIAP